MGNFVAIRCAPSCLLLLLSVQWHSRPGQKQCCHSTVPNQEEVNHDLWGIFDTYYGYYLYTPMWKFKKSVKPAFCKCSDDAVSVGIWIILFEICVVWLLPLCNHSSVSMLARHHTSLCLSKMQSPFSALFMREEIRQDTVCGDKEFCLFQTYSLKGENRPLVTLKGKARWPWKQ